MLIPVSQAQINEQVRAPADRASGFAFFSFGLGPDCFLAVSIAQSGPSTSCFPVQAFLRAKLVPNSSSSSPNGDVFVVVSRGSSSSSSVG